MQQQELRTAANEKVVVTECKVPTEVLDALKKSSFERTPNDQRTLFTYMRGLKAFEKLSDFLLSEVLMVCRLQLFDAEAAVFRQGEVGTAWYIILWGSCKVLISKTGQLADSFHVATMHTGAGFGDLALVNDKPRTATIVTAAPCHLVVVEKSDYNKIIKVLHQSEQKEKLNFLRKIPFLKTWEEILLKPIATLSTVVPYQPNQTIIEQGQPSKNFYLVKKGTVHMMQNHSLPNGTVIKVKVNTLHETEYFGQEGTPIDNSCSL
ncbi:cyclic nucleotide-binding-like protein [Gorgonomyces haynaldii]|nr:cyclic nucleotide-binding-like protein [Gorgonomyces haynaldii]